jgi:hypothetical protein
MKKKTILKVYQMQSEIDVKKFISEADQELKPVNRKQVTLPIVGFVKDGKVEMSWVKKELL